MLRQISSFLLLATCVQYSLQICHNNVCDDDKCSANAQCPSGFECEAVCGYCNPIPGYCSSNNMCNHYDEVCDTASDPYTTCFWCDLTDNTCKPGCNSNTNCDAGYQCNNHLCVESTSCPDDAYCNQGLTGVCDIESSPYTQCMYCEGGDCLPGCLADGNCPHGYTCQEHKCNAQAGKTLVHSITIKTGSCTGCTSEGLTAVLLGERVPGFPDGIPCATNTLDHAGVTEFGDGGSARFDGTLNGAQNDEEESMIGGCFKAPLNNQLVAGTLKWKGDGTWNPTSVCVDWLDDVFANECELTKVAGQENQFELVKCHELTPDTVCS
eukprot:GFUD01022651.1.p1 GENE.GFUD01022651.1~~GFUD01022651.1.p1  ORF type:complete len:324 (+),score=96.56 GFUD01022651.1:35-1006(+)